MRKKLRALAERIGLSTSQPQQRMTRELLVDVSVIARHDARTGIQRVVRAIWLHLPALLPDDVRVRPVYAGKRHSYVYAPDDFLENGLPEKPARADHVHPHAGDLFLGLDLAAHLIPRREKQIAGWKAKGVSIHLLVYDLLPVDHPEWFNARTSRNFSRWLATMARQADQAICISAHVAQRLSAWMAEHAPERSPPLLTSVMRLGADIAASGPSTGLPEDAARLIATIGAQKALLMVGTIEPRKGHDDALAAFEHLWAHADDGPALVIVGKPGWKTEGLQRRLSTHPQKGKRLFWLQDISDEMLAALYKAASGLLVASRAEGFGLPLIEGVRSGLPVLARDLPVFRELDLAGVHYFADGNPEALARAIVTLLSSGQTPGGRIPGWHDATCDLLDTLALRRLACTA